MKELIFYGKLYVDICNRGIYVYIRPLLKENETGILLRLEIVRLLA